MELRSFRVDFSKRDARGYLCLDTWEGMLDRAQRKQRLVEGEACLFSDGKISVQGRIVRSSRQWFYAKIDWDEIADGVENPKGLTVLFADFNAAHEKGLSLSLVGTLMDLDRLGLTLTAGDRYLFSDGEVSVEGEVVQYPGCALAAEIDWNEVDEKSQD